MAFRRSFTQLTLLLSLLVALLFFAPSVLADEEQQLLNPGLDQTLNHILFQPYVEPTSPRHVNAKERIMHLMERPEKDEDLVMSHPRYWILWALYGFTRHAERYKEHVMKWQAKYMAIPERQRAIIRASSDYESVYAEVHELYDANQRVADDIVQVALKYYDITPEELAQFIATQERQENWDNQDRVNEALQHIVRDWSDEGLHERAVPLAELTKILDTHFADREGRKEGPVKVLVPGCGLGRLAHAIAALPGFEVTANEWSGHMRVAYRYIESLQLPESEKFHPFMDWWSYQPNRDEMIRQVTFPDAKANASSVVLVEGDFTKEFANDTAHYDAVVTFFFIDTAPNMMDYLDNLHRVLKPGGLWLNLGPLLYHEASVEFSLKDVVKVAEGYGFEFIDVDEEWGPLTLEGMKVRQREIGYQYHFKSLRRNDYMAQLFAAVKKE